MHFIDKSSAKVLPDCGDSPAKANISILRGANSSLQCGVNAVSDKVECRASAHIDRCA
jgi:hypothetical protein